MYDPLALRPAIQMSQESRSLVVKGLDMTGFVEHDESFTFVLHDQKPLQTSCGHGDF